MTANSFSSVFLLLVVAYLTSMGGAQDIDGTLALGTWILADGDQQSSTTNSSDARCSTKLVIKGTAEQVTQVEGANAVCSVSKMTLSVNRSPSELGLQHDFATELSRRNQDYIFVSCPTVGDDMPVYNCTSPVHFWWSPAGGFVILPRRSSFSLNMSEFFSDLYYDPVQTFEPGVKYLVLIGTCLYKASATVPSPTPQPRQPSPTPTPGVPSTPPNSSSGPNVGIIVGGAVGGALIVGVTAAVITLLVIRSNKEESESDYSTFEGGTNGDNSPEGQLRQPEPVAPVTVPLRRQAGSRWSRQSTPFVPPF